MEGERGVSSMGEEAAAGKAMRQSQGDDSVFIDVQDTSVDDSTVRDYSDDKIDDFDDLAAGPAEVEKGSSVGEGEAVAGGGEEGSGESSDNPQITPVGDAAAPRDDSSTATGEAAGDLVTDGCTPADVAATAAAAATPIESEEERERKGGEGARGGVEEEESVVVCVEDDDKDLVEVEGLEEEAHAQATSTPRDKAKKKSSPAKTLKQRLGQIPARLSKFSIFNALRQGTYVVNEPPPPPPGSEEVEEVVVADAEADADADDGNNIDANNDNANNAAAAASAGVAPTQQNSDPQPTTTTNATPTTTTTTTTPSAKKGVERGGSNVSAASSSTKRARVMTDNGVVAQEDTAQVALTRMPEETLPPEVQSPPGGGMGGMVGEGGDDLPVMHQHHQQPMMAVRKPHSVHRSALTKLLCGLYALMLVVFGVVFAVANSLTVKERQHLYYLEVFLLYLYLGSLATLLYFQFCILRGKQVRNAYLDNSIRVIIRRSQDNLQLSPCPSRKDNNPGGGDFGEEKDSNMPMPGLEPRKEPLDQMSTLSNASDFRSHLVLPPDGQVAHVGEGINFYLRLGCLAFSIGSVTLDGFHIASYFETENTTTCESHIFILVYICHLIFTFVQTFFLFKNHKLVIDKNKASVRFGLMHLLATNLCVWFVTAVTETSEDYRQQDYQDHRNLSDPPALKSCYEDVTLARTASPYLFPCTIIYSIIAGGVVYRMYTYVGIKVKQRWPSHTSLTSSAAPQGVVSMDCEKANKGLFSGLLIAVVTLIAIATFFVFDSRLNNPMTAIQVFFIMEISLLILTGGCIIVGKLRFQRLRFLENYLSLDSVLLLVSLAGAYVYLCFMLISSASTMDGYGVVSVLSLVTIAVGLVQSTIQAIFILDGLCRRAENDDQVESKPGRAVVTFVLVCNLALWVVTLFEIRKTIVVPFHRAFYGILPWNIVLHLCVPLYIYFRFHSAICLSKIWFNAYQKGDKYA